MRLLLQHRTVLHANGKDNHRGYNPLFFHHCSLLQQAFLPEPEQASPRHVCHTETDSVQKAATHADAVLQALRGITPGCG